MKKIVIVLLLMLGMINGFAQAQVASPEQPVPLFSDSTLFAGVLLEATGFGLVVGGGVTASLSLDAALIMMQIAPVFSSTGAWLSHSRMESYTKLWQSRGVDFQAQTMLQKSRTAAIATTVFTAGALILPVLGLPGIYASLACTGIAVGWDMYAFYTARGAWLRELNAAIIDSGIDWKQYR